MYVSRTSVILNDAEWTIDFENGVLWTENMIVLAKRVTDRREVIRLGSQLLWEHAYITIPYKDAMIVLVENESVLQRWQKLKIK